MQAPGSLMLVATFVFATALAIGLAVGLAAPILAIPFILVGFGAEATASGADHRQRADAHGA